MKNLNTSSIMWQATAVLKSYNGRINKDTQPIGISKMSGEIILVLTHAKKQPSTDNFMLCSG